MARHPGTVEVWYDGAWHAVPVRDDPGISITRNAQAEIITSRLSAVLDDREARYNPRNPRSPLYGLIGRNTPLRAIIDGDVRFYGFVSRWRPRRTPDFDPVTGRGDAWVEIEAAGDTRRLGQGTPPVYSPMRRTIRATAPLAYWPAEDGTVSTRVGSDLPGVPAMVLDGGPVEFVPVDQLAPRATPGFTRWGTLSLVDLSGGGRLHAVMPSSVTEATRTVWTVHAFAGLFEQPSPVVLMEWDTPGGTYVRWQVRWRRSPILDTQVVAFDSTGAETVVISTGAWLTSVRVFDISAWQDGGTIRVAHRWSGDSYQHIGSLPGTLAGITAWRINPDAASTDDDPFPAGHFAIWAQQPMPYFDSNLLADRPLDPYGVPVWATPVRRPFLGEAAHLRLERLCAEEGVPFTCPPVPAGVVTRMGDQPAATFLDLLRECARTDDGLLIEPRDAPGLHYRPRADLYNQTPALILDRAVPGQIAPPLLPVLDDVAVRNDVTFERADGSSARAIDHASIDAIGRVTTRIEGNLADDSRLDDYASWHLAKGTVDANRYESVTIDLDANPELAAAAAAVDIGDVIDLRGTEEGGALLLVDGYTERATGKRRTITFTGGPADVWMVGIWENPLRGRLDTGGSELAAAASESDTSLTVATTIGPVWTIDPDALPFDIHVGGEQMTITNISGPSSPQTFSVIRGVNGVHKPHPAGTPVRLAQPMRWAL